MYILCKRNILDGYQLSNKVTVPAERKIDSTVKMKYSACLTNFRSHIESAHSIYTNHD